MHFYVSSTYLLSSSIHTLFYVMRDRYSIAFTYVGVRFHL